MSHQAANRDAWTAFAPDYVEAAERNWASGEIRWGMLREHGFDVERLVELRVPAGTATRYDHVTAEWASRWPVEDVWRARIRR